MFGGKPELASATADAGQRFDDFAFARGGVVAEGIDGITQRAHFAERDLEDVGEFCRAVACRLRRHVKRHRHLPGQPRKFRQVFKGDAQTTACGSNLSHRLRHHAELNRQLFHL